MIKEYLKSNYKTILLVSLIIIINFIILSLYALDMAVTFYVTGILLLLVLVYCFIDYISFKRKHNSLIKLRSDINVLSNIELSSNTIESDYEMIINDLKKDIDNIVTNKDIEYNNMIDYYSMWVHQIKTPIASIRLTLEGEDSPLSRRINSDLTRIEQYVDTVMAYVRLKSNFNDFIIKEYDLDSIIKPVIKRFSNDFINRKLSLVYENVNRKIVTDEKWFSFVLEQILSNSLKYTKKGSIEIKVEYDSLIIKDTGIGIDPSDLPKLFKKGITGFNGRKDKKASGLGLYLSKQIMDKLGLSISIDSKLNIGTTVYLGLNENKIVND